FFQGFSVKHADTLGIVYTPQEIVDFMVESVDEVLKREFGKSIETPGVKILDPATGTGNFIVNILRRIQSRGDLQKKYANDLFCNEITLLPYYIASLNIEHEYFERMGQYESFEGICFADTLELAEGQQMQMFVEENTGRVEREKAAEIMVVIGNPPYNIGQKNENDNNKNRRYLLMDRRVGETYAKASKASNKNALSDAYVKFFRWATDRLMGRDGIICLVSNNSFVDQIAFDGMRQHLLQDFTHIYHLDLHGNVRKNTKLSGTTHNVFGIQIGVGITIAIKNTQHSLHKLYYYRVPELWTRTKKLDYLMEQKNIGNIEWLDLPPDERHTWITEGLKPEFSAYLPMGTKAAKAMNGQDIPALFKTYSPGVSTARDTWAYDFTYNDLLVKVKRFIETYNGEVDRWGRRGNDTTPVDSFVTYDDTKIKWSRDLKLDLVRKRYAKFLESKVRGALYRPFCKRWSFFDRILNEEVYQFPQFFPIISSHADNIVIIAGGYGRKNFAALASNQIPNYNFYGDPAQCFPFYTYAPDGTVRRENITDWALAQFQARYVVEVSKWQIFHYVYGMLHHPRYRERYAENLKRDLPHIPLLARDEAFLAAVSIGKQLMEMHISYEQVAEYALKEFDNGTLPYELSRRVEKMKLSADRTALVVNKSLTLDGIPPECFQYRLGNRSALEWVIDQYQVSKDARSGIESDPNRLDEPEYIVSLVKRVVTVSVKTVALVNELAGAVTLVDWLEETGTGGEAERA
ncbi:MAG: N-6 DNA methylase, partial [Ktedonobacteraceae bacterium]|nr:N-6 DNA methylase [Ktedonobacteraceae bacterium]